MQWLNHDFENVKNIFMESQYPFLTNKNLQIYSRFCKIYNSTLYTYYEIVADLLIQGFS